MDNEMNLRMRAIEAVRKFSYNISDLMANADRMVAFLHGESFYPMAKAETAEPVAEAPKNDTETIALVDTDETLDMVDEIKILAGLSADEQGKIKEEINILREAKGLPNEDAILSCKFSFPNEDFVLDPTEKPEPIKYINTSTMQNYRVDGNPLKPLLLTLGEMFKNYPGNIILNSCRQMGLTTLIAAFARQQVAFGGKVLVLTNNFRSVETLTTRIDVLSATVMDFNTIYDKAIIEQHHSPKRDTGYDYIIIDNASFIPYSMETIIIKYLTQHCNRPAMAGETIPPKLIMCGAPGKKAGWFYDCWVGENTMSKMAINWVVAGMSVEEAANLRKKLGNEIFENQYNNRFREND